MKVNLPRILITIFWKLTKKKLGILLNYNNKYKISMKIVIPILYVQEITDFKSCINNCKFTADRGLIQTSDDLVLINDDKTNWSHITHQNESESKNQN